MKKRTILPLSLLLACASVATLGACKKEDKAFTREDYTFNGDLAGYSIQFKDLVYDNDGNLISQTVDKALLLNEGTELKWLPTPSKDGYNFEGWYLDEDLRTPMYHKNMPAGDLVVYARWSLNQEKIYVAPDGSHSANGKSPSKAMTLWDATRVLKDGGTIVMAEGEYDLMKTINLHQIGTSNKMTTIEGNGATIKFDMLQDSTKRGIQVMGDYINIKDLTICGAGDNGMLISGNNNIIENCVTTECRDTGIQISNYNSTLQPDITTWPSYNLIKNCTSYNNADYAYEDADGFAAKLTVGYGNVFDGCIAAFNADDGWDLYAKQDSGSIGTVTIRNCLSIENGRSLNEYKTDVLKENAGDGNGFKLGGTSMPGQVIVDNCIAAYNYAHGFTDNSNPGVITITNCTAINNGRYAGDTSAPESDSKKSYSNFNLNRDGLVKNKNYYENLFSFYSAEALKQNSTMKTDEFNGSINGGILYNQVVDSSGNKTPKAFKTETSFSSQNGEGFITTRGVEEITITDSMCDFTAPTTVLANCNKDLHKGLRNEDGSVNLKNYFKSNIEIKISGNEKTCGATLNKSSYDEYTHTALSNIPENESTKEANARSVVDAIVLSVNKDYIYNDIYLPTSIGTNKISWSSSNSDLIRIDETEYGTAVKNIYGIIKTKLSQDEQVTLTAKVTVDGITKTKDFTVTLKKFDARLGDVVGIEEKVVLSTETLPDVNDYKLYDYTSSNVQLIKDVDYKEKITINYKQDRYEPTSTEVKEVSAAGFYTITYDFESLDGFYKSQYKCNYTIIEANDTYEIINDTSSTTDVQNKKTTSVYLKSIVENKITINGYAENNNGFIYAVATKDTLVPTQQNIIDLYGKTLTDDYVSNIVKYEITDYAFTLNLDIKEGYEGNADVYMFIGNDNGPGKMFNIADVTPTIKISTYNQFMDAIRNSANSSNAYELVSDIDCSQAESKKEFAGLQLGLLDDGDTSHKFFGYFNGNYHTIKNLYITSKGSKGVGLFPYANNATIKKLRLEEVHVRGNNPKVGTLIGMTEEGVNVSEIQLYNCSAQSTERVGGLIGEITGTKQSEVLLGIKKIGTTTIDKVSILSEKNSLDYNIRCTTGKYIGGILAHAQYGHNISITNCFVNQKLNAVNQYGGGIIGRLDLQTTNVDVLVDHCIFAGYIEVTGQNYMGGIAGGLTTGKMTISNVLCVGQVRDSSNKSNPIVSTNFCTSTTLNLQKVYTLKNTITQTNWYYSLQDYDPENDGETYKTEEEYLEAKLLNNEYYGQYIYTSKFEKVETWKELGFDMDNTFVFKKSFSFGYQFNIKGFEQ